ncbi:hypothetical protein G9C98_006876 [Cotesia typhae]|uniref:Tetraspanin n=1 Tax=Cotesia typhae TaxID=2053667 RepID=A0A8J5UTE7_9HYME|nr:hypothetical protein G9C98_006876 [Cotesia typhae]
MYSHHHHHHHHHHRRRANNFTYVSSCVKYMIFMLNFIFWLFGGLLIGVGIYAFYDKLQTTGTIKVENVYDIVLNISLVMAIAGGVVFIVSFAGCVGALRENTCLLKFFKCCGLSQEGYLDWQKNEYFNCSSPGRESCGVPFSCCINTTDISSGLVNIMCGYQIQTLPSSEASKRIWISGCIEIVRTWAERNLYTIAGIALGIALSQLFVIYLAKTLEGQIEMQRARWRS